MPLNVRLVNDHPDMRKLLRELLHDLCDELLKLVP